MNDFRKAVLANLQGLALAQIAALIQLEWAEPTPSALAAIERARQSDDLVTLLALQLALRPWTDGASHAVKRELDRRIGLLRRPPYRGKRR